MVEGHFNGDWLLDLPVDHPTNGRSSSSVRMLHPVVESRQVYVICKVSRDKESVGGGPSYHGCTYNAWTSHGSQNLASFPTKSIKRVKPYTYMLTKCKLKKKTTFVATINMLVENLNNCLTHELR